MWRVIYICPLIWAVIQIFLIRMFFPEEPILFSISKGNIDDAKSLISKVYNFDDHGQRDAMVFHFIQNTNQSLGSDVSSVTFSEALWGAEYWRATWVSFFINIFNQLSGINAINMFSNRLLMNLQVETNG